jgi:hypothetical protein
MVHKLFLNETVLPSLAGTAAGVALGHPVLQTALVNLATAAVVRLTNYLLTKRRARRAARKTSQND